MRSAALAGVHSGQRYVPDVHGAPLISVEERRVLEAGGQAADDLLIDMDELNPVKVVVGQKPEPKCEGGRHLWVDHHNREYAVPQSLDHFLGTRGGRGTEVSETEECLRCGMYRVEESESTPGNYPEFPANTEYLPAGEFSGELLRELGPIPLSQEEFIEVVAELVPELDVLAWDSSAKLGGDRVLAVDWEGTLSAEHRSDLGNNPPHHFYSEINWPAITDEVSSQLEGMGSPQDGEDAICEELVLQETVAQWLQSGQGYRQYIECFERATEPADGWFNDFAPALRAFREAGGAMNYDTGSWRVASAEEIRDIICEDVSVKYATENALREGGVSDEEIAQLLKDWRD